MGTVKSWENGARRGIPATNGTGNIFFVSVIGYARVNTVQMSVLRTLTNRSHYVGVEKPEREDFESHISHDANLRKQGMRVHECCMLRVAYVAEAM